MSLARARKKAGLSQRDVAQELNITDSAVCQWETGLTHPRMKYMKRLAKLYGTTVDDLLQEDN